MTSLGYEISKRATRQIVAAIKWWHNHRPFAPGLLQEEIERAVEAIADQPHIGSPVRSRRSVELRRYPIGRSGYWLYYRVRNERPLVLALWHQSRGSQPLV